MCGWGDIAGAQLVAMNGTLTTVAMAGDALITKHRFKFVQAYNVCV